MAFTKRKKGDKKINRPDASQNKDKNPNKKREDQEIKPISSTRPEFPPTTQLYIKGLPFDCNQKDVEAFFLEHMIHALSIRLVCDKTTGGCKGVGFADVLTTEDAAKAFAIKKPQILDRKITILPTKTPKELAAIVAARNDKMMAVGLAWKNKDKNGNAKKITAKQVEGKINFAKTVKPQNKHVVLSSDGEDVDVKHTKDSNEITTKVVDKRGEKKKRKRDNASKLKASTSSSSSDKGSSQHSSKKRRKSEPSNKTQVTGDDKDNANKSKFKKKNKARRAALLKRKGII